jgi:hypothetical protein
MRLLSRSAQIGIFSSVRLGLLRIIYCALTQRQCVPPAFARVTISGENGQTD